MSIFSMTLPDTMQTDQAAIVLDQITGVVQYMITGNSDLIVDLSFAQLLRHFNEALLGFGLLIFAIMFFVGTMNTAADGQFLGRNWNSVWTPVRLVIGIVFVVPLQSGFCIAQYIFLYLILIGINMGTYVWDKVIDDVFGQYTPPAIPSYISSYAQQAIESQMIFSSMQQIMAILNPGLSEQQDVVKTTINTGDMINQAGNLPLSVTSLFAQNTGSLCSKLYQDKGIQKACISAIDAVLKAGDSQNGKPQFVYGNLGGNITVWIGQQAPSPATVLTGTYSASTDDGEVTVGSPFPLAYFYNPEAWNNPNGEVTVNGQYEYSFSTQDGNTEAPEEGTVAGDLKNNLQNQLTGNNGSKGGEKIEGFIPQNILDVSNPGQNLCLTTDQTTHISKSNGQCSLAALSNIVITQAQSQIQQDSQGDNGSCLVDKTTGKLTNCPFEQSLDNYAAKGMPLYNADGTPKLVPEGQPNAGEQEYQQISVPLRGSWWNAGQAYLVLDDRLASNLQVLIDAIERNTANLTSNGKLTGTLKVKTNIMVMEAGGEFGTALVDTNNSAPPYVARHCSPVDTNNPSFSSPVICGMGSMMLLPPQNVELETNQVSMADLAGTGTWGAEIAPYNPDLEKDSDKFQYLVSDSTPAFYQQLLNVPVNFQVPLQMLLMEAGKDSGTGAYCLNDNKNCYKTLYPYLVNILNVLAANGLLSSNDSELPINQSMNAMFTQLLGPQDANDPRVRGINSIMQDVYNFGLENPGDIISQQFSLMQQIRNTGVGMIVTCIGSMEVVYSHYRQAMTNMIDEVIDKTKGPEARAAQGLAGSAVGLFTAAGGASFLSGGFAASLGFLGQASQTASQVLQMQLELSIATTTITTMSNIGIQLMWLPLFMFIITSLFTAGVQFALVIPFMPYIMFWAGQIAWVIGVLEALVAAPLVMLAFAHPGGSDHLGHAGPAVRFLIGIVFRPVLMVIGLITGILLTYILIRYSADGFHIVAAGIFSSLPAADTTFMGVMSCLLLFAYASFLVMAFTKCFSPIYLIPEKVVQWIGGQAEQAGAQEAQQFSSGVQQTAQAGAQAGGQSVSQGIQAQEKRGQGMSDLSQKQMTTQMGQIGKGSEMASQGAGSAMQFNNARKSSGLQG